MERAKAIAMISELMQIAVKVLFTGILVLLIALFAIEIWRLWFDRTLVLVPFGYIRDGQSVPEAGQHFTQLVSQDLYRLRDIYRSGPSVDVLIPSTDQIGRGQNLEFPVRQESVLSAVEIQAYGIQLSTLVKALMRWIERPNQIVGSISERGKRVDVYAELRSSSPTVAANGQGRWYISEMKDMNEASFALACRIFRMLAASQSPLYAKATDADFYVFTRALQNYQLYRARLVEVTSKEQANKALAKASQLVTELSNRDSQFPFVYKLAVYAFREEGNLEKATKAITRYLTLLRENKQSDKTVEDMLALLQSKQPRAEVKIVKSAEALNLRTRLRPVQPGTSVGSPQATAGTICCLVRDDRGENYLLSAEHPLFGEIGTPVLQPGPYDGGQQSDQIAQLARTIPVQRNKANRLAGAIARLMQDVKASPEVPGIGQIRGITTAVKLGETVRMVGRTSGLVEGKVLATDVSARIVTPTVGGSFEPTLFDGLIRTTPMSAGGDSGAPVLTEDGKLVGRVYAGSSQFTLVMPIEPVLRALDVELVQ